MVLPVKLLTAKAKLLDNPYGIARGATVAEPSMQYLNQIQSVLLLDGRTAALEQVAGLFLKAEDQRARLKYTVPEAKKGVFYRLYCAETNFMVTLEYIDKPASAAVFAQAMGSLFTLMACGDMKQRLARHRSHILINVSHGLFGAAAQDAAIAAAFQRIGFNEGQSLASYMDRLRTLVFLTRVADHVAPASVVHWTPCNNLLSKDAFLKLADAGIPGPLHIHPVIFGLEKRPGGEAAAGIRSFGARHFIGMELLVEPTILPWAANLEIMLAFLRVATADRGYIIPDGDTFAPEDGSWSYRALYRPASPGDVPIIELKPLIHRQHNFQADSYVKPPRIIDDQNPPPELMPDDPVLRDEITEEWRQKRAMAEAVGNRFQVRGGDRPQEGWMGRVFGRKGRS